jgi:signal transduction histidine kinase
MSFITLRQREDALISAMRDEVRAHALTLQIALEDYYAEEQIREAQQLIDRLSQNTNIYGVVLFKEDGSVDVVSNTLITEEIRQPPELKQVIETGQNAEFTRSINGTEVFSIIKPIHVGAGWKGAFEIIQPLSFVRSDIRRVRLHFAITTLLIFATIFLVVFMVLRRSLYSPIKELLGGASALGRGDLDYRVIVPERGNEFAQLARDFNRMADSLATEQRRVAEEAEARVVLERELRHTERLAAVGRLAAGIAHELGAPLNVIDARADQLQTRSDASIEMRQRNLTIIRAQVERMTRLIRQLLNLARPYELRRRPVDLSELIASTVEQIEESALRARVEIEVSSKDKFTVDGDQDFLREVMLNICANALQAMPEGGHLKISYVRAGATREGRQFACIRITDTGTGITPEHLPHIFDPFYTTKDVGSGTGLGLAVSRRIVEEHGGWIEVVSEGGGAEFSVYLPLYD